MSDTILCPTPGPSREGPEGPPNTPLEITVAVPFLHARENRVIYVRGCQHVFYGFFKVETEFSARELSKTVFILSFRKNEVERIFDHGGFSKGEMEGCRPVRRLGVRFSRISDSLRR